MTSLSIQRVFFSVILACFALLHAEIPMLANGDATGYYIAPDSTLYAWGINNHGQLGLGHRDTTFFATRIDKSKWIWVSSRDSFAVAIKADSTLWAWGQNNRGQLGVGDTLERLVPTQVGSAKWRTVTTAGGYPANKGHWCLGVQADSSLWSWGSNAEIAYNGDSVKYVLGLASRGDQWKPTLVSSMQWLDISATFNHALALDKDSLLWGWGENRLGNLGGVTDAENKDYIMLPIKITGEQKWTSIWAGSGTSMMRALDGSIWAMGENSGAILGRDPNKPIVSPQMIIAESPLKMTSGFERSLAIAPDSTLWAWGSFSSSQYINVYIGTNGSNSSTFGSPIDKSSHWKVISMGHNTSSVLRSDGAIFWWGDILKYSYWGSVDDMVRDKENVFVRADLAPVSLSWDTRVYFDTLSTVSIKQPYPNGIGAKIHTGTRLLYTPSQLGTVSIHALNGKRIGTVELHHGRAELPALQRGFYILRLPNGQNLKWNNMDN